ncbi:hypothetical protein [Streptomyces graminilatus]|uniref:hypothetical protein n=1 Tax=Streptomyces graminilatus TaxID=1464070 RepID=UPI0006E44DE7|nr:hypothetical protein [Streptomyces graminilatus]
MTPRESGATVPTIWRGPEDLHWEETGERFDETARQWMFEFTPAVQDPETGRWAATDCGEPIEVPLPRRQEAYTEVSDDPLAEPRIARLHTLVTALLADYETQTSRPHPATDELRTALEDVAHIPKRESRRRHAAVWNARRR